MGRRMDDYVGFVQKRPLVRIGKGNGRPARKKKTCHVKKTVKGRTPKRCSPDEKAKRKEETV